MRVIHFLALLIFLANSVYANDAEYFPAEMNRRIAPLNITLPSFDNQIADIILRTKRSIPGYDRFDRPVSIPANTQLIMQTTLDSIYEGFRKPQFDFLFSKDKDGEGLTYEDPEALQFKAIMMELIQLKMQENIQERFGGTTSEREKTRTERKKKEEEAKDLVEVTVKKENGDEEKIKVDLKKSLQDGALDVQEDGMATAKLSTDFNGAKTWNPDTKKVAEGDTPKIRCLFCPKEDPIKAGISKAIEGEAVTKRIQEKYSSYSKDKEIVAMVDTAKKHKRDPKEYASSVFRWCYRYVKDAMVRAKVVSKRLEGVSPKFAGVQLEKEGFVNIMNDKEFAGKITDPNQAPKGAILVYEPVARDRWIKMWSEKQKKYVLGPDHGHIEIKTEESGKGGFVSDYESVNARTGRSLQTADRKLIGIYVKTAEK